MPTICCNRLPDIFTHKVKPPAKEIFIMGTLILPQTDHARNGQLSAINWTTRIAVTAAALVILSAGILGYTALYDLFVSIGLFVAWLGIFFPLLFDLAEVTAAVSVFNAKLQGEDDKFAWGMVIFFTILGIVANIGHGVAAWWVGRIDTLQVILAVFCTSLFPLSVALVTHLVKRVIARDITRRGHLSTLAELTAACDQAAADLHKLTGQVDQARAELDKLSRTNAAPGDTSPAFVKGDLAALNKANEAKQDKVTERRVAVLSLVNEGLSPADIANELGVTVRTIKRDITALNGQVRVTQ